MNVLGTPKKYIQGNAIRGTPYIILGKPGTKISLLYWRNYCLRDSEFPKRISDCRPQTRKVLFCLRRF